MVEICGMICQCCSCSNNGVLKFLVTVFSDGIYDIYTYIGTKQEDITEDKHQLTDWASAFLMVHTCEHIMYTRRN